MILGKNGLVLLLIIWIYPAFSADHLSAVWITEPPVIDGKLEDKAWLAVAKSCQGVITGWISENGKLIDNQRVTFIGYDDSFLYLASKNYVADVKQLASKGSVWTEDSLEIHIENGTGDYFHFIVSSSGQKDAMAFTPVNFKAACFKGSGFWSVEVAVPWNEIGVMPAEERAVSFNVAGYDYHDKWITFGSLAGSLWLPLGQEHLRKGARIDLWQLHLK